MSASPWNCSIQGFGSLTQRNLFQGQLQDQILKEGLERAWSILGWRELSLAHPKSIFSHPKSIFSHPKPSPVLSLEREELSGPSQPKPFQDSGILPFPWSQSHSSPTLSGYFYPGAGEKLVPNPEESGIWEEGGTKLPLPTPPIPKTLGMWIWDEHVARPRFRELC